VFVCPIQDGGGTKVKILDALSMGKAIVSTSIGCEGIAVKHGENILIADTPEDFANAVSTALESKSLREQLGAAGRTLVERKYSWGVVGGHLKQAYIAAQRRSSYDHSACSEVSAASV
jgi:glycosyltransferase involved in cell wall biosynthesis